ncbi:hypothetical protein MtrunA17_Chr3g0119411 [Medicago truncatula]|uniref:Transmembrane protein, putative n=1 Tax=Medicago truncatula TaxID=3880 RepID=A0A072V183_MEDTR|nr:transmembrane protein, putative [Medicago truncatula]RHN68940.1 hypothetical protein MtrunA17_Chr3g0119411 [Medicago truncatula]
MNRKCQSSPIWYFFLVFTLWIEIGYHIFGFLLLLSKSQLVGTMHNICKVWVQTSTTNKKKSSFNISFLTPKPLFVGMFGASKTDEVEIAQREVGERERERKTSFSSAILKTWILNLIIIMF